MIKGKMISKKEFKKLTNPKIIGMVNQRTRKKDDKSLIVGNKYYFIKPKCNGITTGYIETENKDYIIKKSLTAFIIPAVIIFLGFACFMLLNSSDNKINDRSLKKETGENISIAEPADNGSIEMIDVGGHGDTLIDENNKYLYLINAETNTVYFQYDVLINNKVIYSTEAFAPGKMVKVNLYDLLENGKYSAVLQLKTYDIKTELANNGANESIVITVQK